ncbi:MAG: hypothetical protein E7222_14610 [Clostridiales bacterium]|nr:hypothetical protein [Clostridiales bacterium]
MRWGNRLIKVVPDMRRCGKSYLLFNFFKEHGRPMLLLMAKAEVLVFIIWNINRKKSIKTL